MSRIASLLRRTFGLVREHVGTDHVGNKYYFIPEQKNWTGRVVRAKRMVVAANPSELDYREGSIPSEWDAWIRGRRKQPPTEQEILNNVQYREQIKVKALEVEDKDRALQGKEYEDGLVARPALAHVRGHAAATQFGRPETSEDPVSAGNTFQPGTWAPPGEKK